MSTVFTRCFGGTRSFAAWFSSRCYWRVFSRSRRRQEASVETRRPFRVSSGYEFCYGLGYIGQCGRELLFDLVPEDPIRTS